MDPKLKDLGDDVDPETGNFVKKESEFSKFGAVDYLKTYYPEIERDDAMEILGKISQNNGTIDLHDFPELSDSPETLENLAIIDFQRKVAIELAKAYPQDKIEVLDVGSGPTIYQHIAVALQCSRIVSSEYLAQNRQEVLNWLKNTEDSYDWDSYFKTIQQFFKIDGNFQKSLEDLLASSDPETSAHAQLVKRTLEGSVEEFKDFIKARLQESDVVPCDVFQEDLGLGGKDQQYEAVQTTGRAVDLLTSNFTIESATGDRNQWLTGLNNVMARVKPGGFLSMSAIRNATWYKVGEEKMPAVSINEDELGQAIESGGFKIIEQTVLTGSNVEQDGYDGMVFILAQKI